MKLRKHRGVEGSASGPITVSMAKEMQARKDSMQRLAHSEVTFLCEQWRKAATPSHITYRDLLAELSQPRSFWDSFCHGFWSLGAARPQARIRLEGLLYDEAVYDDWLVVGNDLCDAYAAYTIAEHHGRTTQPEAEQSHWR